MDPAAQGESMNIEQEDGYRPITIVLETERERALLYEIMRGVAMTGNGGMEFRDFARKFIDRMDEL